MNLLGTDDKHLANIVGFCPICRKPLEELEIVKLINHKDKFVYLCESHKIGFMNHAKDNFLRKNVLRQYEDIRFT